MIDSDIKLDLRGLNCPLPVLKAKKAMGNLNGGQRVFIETTDPLAAIDIPAFCSEDGHVFVEMQEAEGFNIFVVICG